MRPDLPTRYKGRYPFRLACPSFIYPAGYVENVRRLGACVDEIELLLLESTPDCLPAKREIDELSLLGNDCSLTYNIHLPTDVSLGADDPDPGNAAVDALLRAIDCSRPLTPVSYALHVPFAGVPGDLKSLSVWQDRVRKNLERLLTESGLPGRAIALETLGYPLEYLETVIRELDFSICLDTGHLMVQKAPCQAFYQAFQQRIIIIHVHGVVNGRDHLALDRLSTVQTREIGHILKHFRHSVSLEVFSGQDLAVSLDCLDRIWKNLSKSNND